MKFKNIISGSPDFMAIKGKNLPQLLQKNISEILIMSDYASSMGIILMDTLPKEIAHLASLSFKLGDTSTLQEEQIESFVDSTKDLSQFEADLTLSIKVHNQLSNLISPVSSASLIATQPGIFKHNVIMKISLIFTIISLILLIGNLFFSEILSFAIENVDYRNLVSGLLNYTSIVLAAILGSGVYSLYTARKYLIERTFEPKYNSVYTLRFVLGIALGTILGLFGGELGITGTQTVSEVSSETNGVNLIAKLGPVVLAIVGAFSSDAVVSILQRIAETLQVVVKGSGENIVASETEKAKNKEKNRAVNLLLEIKNQVSSAQSDSSDIGNITNIIDKYIAEK